MQELLALYRFALRAGDRPLAEALARAMRSDPVLQRQADIDLQLLPRGQSRWSEAGERAVAAALRRIDSATRGDGRTIGTAMASAIEQRAERVLADVPDWIWDGDRLPVPVEHIADSFFGLHVRDVEDLRRAPGVPADLPAGQALSGLLLPSLGEIWVNAAEAREWPPRRRFTIGHELGHWSLHRGGGAVWCRSHTVDPPTPPDAEPVPRRAYPPEESQANEFAAALLMPAHLVKRHYDRLRRRDPDGCFQQLCRLFGTSGAAMSRRLNRVV